MALVQNNTKGYGYKYATMADIEKQGFKIPKMKTGTDPESKKEYIYFLDADTKHWERGAEIVVPEMKGMNKAQQYASAVTFARRLTVQMADCLACTDDMEIENTTESGDSKKRESVFDEPDTEKEKLVEDFFRRLSSNQIDFIYKKHGVNDAAELTVAQLKGYIDLQKSREREGS